MMLRTKYTVDVDPRSREASPSYQLNVPEAMPSSDWRTSPLALSKRVANLLLSWKVPVVLFLGMWVKSTSENGASCVSAFTHMPV